MVKCLDTSVVCVWLQFLPTLMVAIYLVTFIAAQVVLQLTGSFFYKVMN